MKQNQALIIMAKYPHPDLVKTRLRGRMPDDIRVEIYKYLLVATVQKLKNVQGTDTYISYTPRSEEGFFRGFGLSLQPQSEGDVGDRMFHAINSVLGEGYEKAVLVGVDIPDLSDAIVLKAFSLLDTSDLVFGPAEDGGYYLVGMKKPIREIFSNISWSTERTLAQSIQKAVSCGHRVSMTELLYDVDTAEDAQRSGFGPGHDRYRRY